MEKYAFIITPVWLQFTTVFFTAQKTSKHIDQFIMHHVYVPV